MCEKKLFMLFHVSWSSTMSQQPYLWTNENGEIFLGVLSNPA